MRRVGEAIRERIEGEYDHDRPGGLGLRKLWRERERMRMRIGKGKGKGQVRVDVRA